LSKLLPEESRKIIVKMLEPIPSQRASFIDIFSDPWVKQISCPISDEDLE
jgi:serine/threonine protein kinase